MTTSVASAAEANLAQVGERILARVHDSNHATDLAFALSPARLAVIRCVERASPEDHTALATILTEGDFVWAGLVYGEREGSETIGLIETFHVSQLHQLVARLDELREAFDEASSMLASPADQSAVT